MSSDLYTLNRECRDLTRRIERLHQDVVYFGISGNFENKKFSSRLTPDNAEEKFNRVLEEYTNLSDRVTKGKYSSVSYQRLLGLVEISKKLGIHLNDLDEWSRSDVIYLRDHILDFLLKLERPSGFTVSIRANRNDYCYQVIEDITFYHTHIIRLQELKCNTQTNKN